MHFAVWLKGKARPGTINFQHTREQYEVKNRHWNSQNRPTELYHCCKGWLFFELLWLCTFSAGNIQKPGTQKHAESAKALHKSSDISRVRVAFEELPNCWKPQLCIETILRKNALNIQYNFLNLKACNFPHSLHSQHLPANCMKNYTWGTFKLSLGATPIEVNALIYLFPKKISVKQCVTWASEV